MAPGVLIAGYSWRHVMAIILLAGAVWLAVAHARMAETGRDRAIAVALEGDGATVRPRLIATANGLAMQLNDAQRVTLRRNLAADPLNGTTIALAALDRTAQGDTVGADALIRQAIRVDPRTRLAWLALLHHQMRSDRPLVATTSTLRLLAIDPQHAATYLPVLATLARDGETTALIATALQRAPTWRTQLFERLAQDKVDPVIRYALVNPPERRAIVDANRDDAAFVANLVATGDVDRAYLAWLSLLPDTALNAVGTPYDSSFDGLPGAAPFNWQFSESDTDRATLGQGMLSISYSGRQSSVLAQQIVLLDPDVRYRLRSVLAAADHGSGDGATLTWRVFCLPRYDVIAELQLDPSATGTAQRSVPFTVPTQRCEAVSLALVGTANDIPRRVTAQIASVSLDRLFGADTVAVATPTVANPDGAGRP